MGVCRFKIECPPGTVLIDLPGGEILLCGANQNLQKTNGYMSGLCACHHKLNLFSQNVVAVECAGPAEPRAPIILIGGSHLLD